jgi:hypothetical protein
MNYNWSERNLLTVICMRCQNECIMVRSSLFLSLVNKRFLKIKFGIIYSYKILPVPVEFWSITQMCIQLLQLSSVWHRSWCKVMGAVSYESVCAVHWASRLLRVASQFSVQSSDKREEESTSECSEWAMVLRRNNKWTKNWP